MSDIDEVIAVLKNLEIHLVGDPVRDASEGNKFYAFINVHRSKGGKQIPSNYKLRRISEEFEKRDRIVSFIIVENDTEDLLASLKSSLFRFFPDQVRNVFLSDAETTMVVWVEPKKLLTQEEEGNITSKIQDIFNVLEMKLEIVKFTASENIPTKTACLGVIRLKSPLTKDEIQSELIARNFHIPNAGWLAKMLDNLRKADLILRRDDGMFVLTLSGLQILGTRKNRRSPDVFRVLDIVRRID